jgi:hypothetical protein
VNRGRTRRAPAAPGAAALALAELDAGELEARRVLSGFANPGG